jgi:hypothetical protein
LQLGHYREEVCEALGISGIRPCSPEETREHMEYLSYGCASQNMATGLHEGDLALWIGQLTSLESLGSLPSAWSEIGPRRSNVPGGGPKFLIREALAVLRASPFPGDAKRVVKIGGMMDCYRKGELSNPITVGCMEEGSAIVVDGNHTAVAIHEVATQAPKADFRQRVYIIAKPEAIAL